MREDIVMTVRGKMLLDQELDELIKVEREKIKVAIAEARALGDLKENAEYQSAKEKQAYIEGRIKELQYKVNNAKVIDVSQLSGTTVRFGATVTLYDEERERRVTYQIVGTDEADSKLNKISFSGPLGMALVGKNEGDTVVVQAPKGAIEYEIEKVVFIP